MFLKRVIFITKIPEFMEMIGLQTKENPSEIMLIFPLACPSLHHSSTADWRGGSAAPPVALVNFLEFAKEA